MGWCKKDVHVTPVRQQWSYIYLAPTHRFEDWDKYDTRIWSGFVPYLMLAVEKLSNLLVMIAEDNKY